MLPGKFRGVQEALKGLGNLGIRRGKEQKRSVTLQIGKGARGELRNPWEYGTMTTRHELLNGSVERYGLQIRLEMRGTSRRKQENEAGSG